ncbi:transcriptional regulator [Alicyclobacillus cycloheptanicus]|uniref:DNA-binding transcriptional regulator of glucitol operon n=1 Tax=Alicyclobacillus cycloheptanicus TaxID=1457 RepID=A0ABT9XLL7_9BACL|nr:transcriptional regulator GutM [Alicyclobacillus cycloheptanicus]MDQ0191201.1 DNA-binding transcriptional regulator of glucitol operon [Alicyclobacillus cycloheptanicus]WDM02115.1 transcriptional regulator [Alicyclobacillus cycloheptanicus]
MHSVFGFIALIGAAWLLQFALTWLQIRHYRGKMRDLVHKYQHAEGFSLFSGVARKALGSGAIVLIIVDQQQTIGECQVLTGISVFAKFKEEPAYAGMRVREAIERAERDLQRKRRISARQQSIAKALKMAAENAVRAAKPPVLTRKETVAQ